jgi:hypothetical protein
MLQAVCVTGDVHRFRGRNLGIYTVIHLGEGLRRVADRRTCANEFRIQDVSIYPYLVPVKRSGAFW